MKDPSSDIIHMVATILEACQSALDKAEPALQESDEQPVIARELLLILNTADDLLEMLDPSKEAAEYHGLPRMLFRSWGLRAAPFNWSEPACRVPLRRAGMDVNVIMT